jgi:hypothetical protein
MPKIPVEFKLDRVVDRFINDIYEASGRLGRIAAAPAEVERDLSLPEKYISMSDIGSTCTRAIWFAYKGYAKGEMAGKVHMLLDLGNLIEDDLITRIEAAGYLVDRRQAHFTAFNGRFRGRCDGVVHGLTQEPHLLEIKSANSNNFEKFKRLGVLKHMPKYYCQCQVYMGYAGLSRALILIYNKNTSELYGERFNFARRDFNALTDRAHFILQSVEPPADVDEKGCFICSFGRHCDVFSDKKIDFKEML